MAENRTPRFKRTRLQGAPNSLLFGEPAYSDKTRTLYIGRADESVLAIAGAEADGSTRLISVAYAAAASLSALRLVNLGPDGLRYADPAADSTVLGLTLHALAPGETPQLVLRGPVSDSSWAWLPQQFLFLGDAGVLTATSPQSGRLIVVGQALSATEIFLSPQPAIQL